MKTTFPIVRTLMAAGVAATLSLAACSKPDHPPGQMSDSAAAASPKDSASLGAALDDTGITAQVKGKLASDVRTKDTDIDVETNNGVVTLMGMAPNGDVKSAAEELARNVGDVKGVDNKMNAPSTMETAAAGMEGKADKAEGAVSDTWITTKVKSSLIADDQIKGTKIDVTTQQGVVKLSGAVASETVRTRVVEVTQKIEGVKQVDDSSLMVSNKS